jgi:hypothetical protein
MQRAAAALLVPTLIGVAVVVAFVSYAPVH